LVCSSKTWGLPIARRPAFLNGLRAFETAARHGSFTLAAKDLNVTQAAVSQQVRLLERRLGFALFKRRANELELTDQGRAFQPGLTDAFDRIERLTDQVTAMRSGPVLVAGIAPAFALHWLIPRLAKFNRAHPEVEFRMATGGERLPLRDDWTCSVRRGVGDWPGYVAEELFAVPLVPVCTPSLAKGLRQPRDLARATLIVVAHLRAQWTWWFEAAGLSAPVKPAGEIVFENSPMAIKAVLDGVGVAVAQLPYVSDALAAGRLVSPFPIVSRRYEGWYLVYRPVRKDDPGLLAFRDWLFGEAELQREEYERLISSSKRPPNQSKSPFLRVPAGARRASSSRSRAG
jgi:LysR family glycine cleavage system transcriptional activator/LysR family transcriptional regulator of beta-lactamase